MTVSKINTQLNNINDLDIHNFDNLKKFPKDIMLTIINNYYTEEEKITLLRNKEFIETTPPLFLELMLNNMNFIAVFNMLQNENIASKISYLDLSIHSRDYFLIPSYLESEKLIQKVNHRMLKNMLINLEKEDVINYLAKEYILKKLTNKDLIEISIKKDINLVNEINLINTLNKNELIKYINGIWHKKIDYTFLNNKYVQETLFNYTDFNLEEVIYLYELINTKSVLTIQKNPHTISSFKAVISAYLLLGIEGTKELINTGNSKINIDIAKSLNPTKETLNKNFQIKSKISRIYQQTLIKEYVNKLKVKVLISALSSKEKDKFSYFFKEQLDLNSADPILNID